MFEKKTYLDCFIAIRCSLEEKYFIKNEAKKKGMSQSNYLRYLLRNEANQDGSSN